MKSQVEPSPSQFLKQLAEGISSFVASEGYDIEPSELALVLEGGDLDLIPQKLYATIIARGYDKARVERSLAKGKEIFTSQRESMNASAQENGVVRKSSLKEISVDDIRQFRKTLKLKDKPAPVQPLETFYERGSPKL